MSGTVANRNLLFGSAWIFVFFAGSAFGQTQPGLQPATTAPPLQPAPTTDRPAEAASTTVSAPIQLVSGEAPIKSETTGEALKEKHEEVTTQLRVALLQEQAQKANSDVADTAPKANESEVDLLKQVEVIVAQQQSATATLEDVKAKSDELKLELGKLAENRLEEDPPYSVMMVDQLRDSIKALNIKSESLQASLLAARDGVEQTRRIVDEKKRAARQLKEKNPDADLKVANLEVQLAEEMLVLRRQEFSIEEANESVRKLQLEVDTKKLEIIGSRVTFSKEMLDKQIADLELREIELKRKAETLQIDLQNAERRWLAARQEVDSTPTPGADLIERVDALKTDQQTIQQELSVTNQRLQRFPMIKTALERRFLAISEAASRDERRTWLEETIKQIEQLGRERRSRELKIEEVRATLAGANSKLDAIGADDSGLKRWLEMEQTALNKQAEILTSSFLAIDSATKSLERLRMQLEGEKARTFEEWAADMWRYVGRIWNYQLAEIDDNFLTVGKVVNSVLFLFFGFLAATYLSRLLGRRLPNLGVDEAGTSVIESLSFYVMLVAFGLMALRYANVPLTVFTFLGGAIAIGVGFGSQNILNNFISGLILLAERPIKVGDLIQLEQTYGNVTKIGARSTQIRTGENLDIIVPNSKFLENDVTNLTRRDDRLRTSINVGVAYGSPLERVVVLLEQAASAAPDVQDRPKPMVWFNDFGDNSLMFQVHFWIKARTMTQMKRIETDVRLNIDRLFRENEIVIAFPQRDLHIQSPKPIELRLLGSGDSDDQQLRAAS
jgi:small-conductance mechanosensitive channel